MATRENFKDFDDDELVDELRTRGYDFSDECDKDHSEDDIFEDDNNCVSVEELRRMADDLKMNRSEDVLGKLKEIIYNNLGIIL